MVRIGVHIDQADPLAEATARGADAVQFFLSYAAGHTRSFPGNDVSAVFFDAWLQASPG